MPFILQTNRLSKKIGSKMLVTDVDIHIRKGEIYGFLGPNGAGKTTAMKMIASSKLHRAQAAISNFLPYQQKLDEILTNLLASDTSYESPFIQKRETARIAIVVFASNSSLAGAYNSNVIKEFNATYAKYNHLGKDNILL